ncbi:hypothetical protein COLO4_08601 [Corchorus olitorius]|uniref:Uncharacterized protein n=1 Tax=Corchorus olitorius TaxID=93759 RepID=A0A1R3KFA0_9ROSI|nr:hypothetical protein COLO4_08601 [Corchorus olitorius]
MGTQLRRPGTHLHILSTQATKQQEHQGATSASGMRTKIGLR